MDFADSDNIVPESGFGSVTNVPRLPDGFADVFSSWRVDTGKIRLHAVIGGTGEPLLLHSGWPQNWFAWRYVMLALSKQFTVIAVDPRGFGLSDRPADGFDVDRLADDMFDLMDMLGHERFVMAGHDIGVMVGYAMAAMRPERIRRVALGEGTIPGASPSPELIPDDRRMSDFLWHFNFNRALEVNERLVEGREDIYFNYQFATKAGSAEAVPQYARDFYIEILRRVPGTLKASFNYYRAIDETIPQVRRHMQTKVTVPVFAFSGALACGPMVENEQRQLATDVESLIIPECGHFPAEEQPEALTAALLDFFSR
ncbi:alpha/beta hydrolase [Altericroceibacterium spongiae]|uniref:Alpha/beta hydrolase n=1 Tax=Altericroceibacterium spongiae TaxID=2320269 RepID=A0A420ES62_9SPHN|nr:alpha/beta hydrolase [Altericroceibacterium spongiae]RKF23463.1 alpha/beta hydrolase [Altericroceibacterium spongiae]